MRNEMQQIRQLSALLEKTEDRDERERIEEEIAELEDWLESMDDYEYNSHSNARYLD